jgi:hypothetical protein
MCANCESERNGVVGLCGAKKLKMAQNLHPQMAPNYPKRLLRFTERISKRREQDSNLFNMPITSLHDRVRSIATEIDQVKVSNATKHCCFAAWTPPPSSRKKLNTPEPTYPLGLPVCLLHLSVVCKPVQIFPCMECPCGKLPRLTAV